MEEEKAEHEAEKLTQNDSAHEHLGTTQEQHGFAFKHSEVFGCRKRHQRRQYTCRFRSHCKEGVQDKGPAPEACHERQDQWKGHCHRQFWSRWHGQSDGAPDHGSHQRWKRRCHGQFRSHLWSQQRSLDAVTWTAAMVFGLQLSRKPQLQTFFEAWKDPDKRQQWWSLLLRVAFSMPPDTALTASRSIIQGPLPQQRDAEAKSAENTKKYEQNVPETVVSDSEDTKTLSDVMREFESSCQSYAAVASSVSGVLAAEQGQLMAAVEHLQLASRLGHAPAYFNLAMCYETGLGVAKDQKQAAFYYQLAAEAGHAQSIFNLALMTLRGEGGLSKDRVKAIQLLNKAAKQGLAQAQTYLGVYYTEDDDNQQDFEQAASFFKAAASQEDAEAQYFLGICYENGWGVESSDEEAARLYSTAAELGHDGALYNLAAFHEYGLGGIACDEAEAMGLYRRAAERGNESAKFRLEEEEARQAVSLWSEQNDKTGRDQSPALRHSPHSSSPVLSDYVRESMAGLWSGELSAWFSSQSLTSSSKNANNQRPAFILGDYDTASAMDAAGVETDRSVLAFPLQHLTMDQGCSTGLHRTSTMPELRLVSCQ